MICLTNEHFLSSGGARDVYRHPSKDHLCLKLQRELGNHNSNEMKFFIKYKSNQFIPKYYGMVPTNLGSCLAIELIKDFDGLISQSLQYYVENRLISKELAMSFIDMISANFLENGFLIHDEGIQNILLRKVSDNKFDPLLIDGFGAGKRNLKNFIRVKFPFFGRIKTIKQIKMMKKRVSSYLP